jgi:Ferric reductase like transmembrane component/Bacterial TSP3 repeat
MHNIMSGKLPNLVLVSIALLFLLWGLSVHASSVPKDSDADGLTDQAEQGYFTNPEHADSDGDGATDTDEILAGTNPLESASHPRQSREENITGTISYAWFIGRASGIVAFILLTIVVVNGLLMSTRLVFRLLPPALNYEMHRFFSWMALVAVIGHFVSFTYDQYFHLTYFEGLVPFVLMRDFSSNLGYDLRYAVGIGTIALYGIVALIISSELKGRGVSLKKWRALHYSSFLTYILFLAHGILSGTDSETWWMIWLYSLSAFMVLSLTALRIYGSLKTKKETPLVSPSSTTPNVSSPSSIERTLTNI